jgi:hypothetical protein
MLRLLGVMMFAGMLGAGCDALFTGEKVARFPLTAETAGGYVPLTITLGPDMNPVALNLQAEYAASATEAGKWNSYRATLTKSGAPVGTGDFRINNTSDPMSPSAQVVSRTMIVIDVKEVGDYELKIDALAPAAVTLGKPQVELRRNIRRDLPPK